MKLLREIGAEVQLEIQSMGRKAQNYPWQTLKKKLEDSILDTALSVGNLLSILTKIFGMTAPAVKAEFFRKGEKHTKRKLKGKWPSGLEQTRRGNFMKSNDKLIRINPDEYDLILEWGNQFVLMAKRNFIAVDQFKIQKSQQLIDGLTDSEVSNEMGTIAKIYEDQKEARTEVNKNIIHKDHPEMTIEDQVGEAYGGE